MFVAWKVRELDAPIGYRTAECPHRNLRDREAPFFRLSLRVIFAFRDDRGRPRQQVIWQPGLHINACCLHDINARLRFWRELDGHLARLRTPPNDETRAAVLLDREAWLREAVAAKVPS